MKKTEQIEIYCFDSDCLSTFLSSNRMDILFKLIPAPKNFIVPKQVFDELIKHSPFQKRLNQYIVEKKFTIMEMPLSSNEIKTYLQLIKDPYSIGRGEASAIALCHEHGYILASNNLRDVLELVDIYDINWVTTCNLIKFAFEKDFVDETQANVIWKKIKTASLIPCSSFTKYYNHPEQYDVNYKRKKV